MVVMMFSNDAWGALALLGGGESEKRRHTYMIVQYAHVIQKCGHFYQPTDSDYDLVPVMPV